MLDVWERGLRQPLQRQVVALLAAVVPGSSEADIAALPLGTRDAMLLDLRGQLFGPECATVATCPNCGTQLEASFSLDDVRTISPPIADIDPVALEGHRIAFRPPATADLLAIPEGADPATARTILFDRCVTALDAKGERVDCATLPPSLVASITDGMASADPQAVIELNLDCAGCGRGFVALFDIAAFLTREIHGWARQMLRDIDTLARAYGWREGDILALSPMRRQIYVEMVTR